MNKRTIALVFVLVSFLFISYVEAQEEARRTLFVGKDLQAFASVDDYIGEALYVSYVAGVAETLLTISHFKGDKANFCPNTTNEELGDAVRMWMRDNPTKLHLPASWIVIFALTHYFPCTAE